MNTKHTPTPWAVGSTDGATFLIWQETPGKQDVPYTVENREFITRACNSHDDLVAALELALQTVDFEKSPYRGWHLHARNALDKAKGE